MPQDKQSFVLGLRPEHIHVSNKANAFFRGKVNLIGSLGGEKVLYIGVERFEIAAKVSGELSVKEGQTIDIGFDEKYLLAFDKQSGRRLNF